MEDATGAEIFEESDAVLEALVDGTMAATWVTREMAKQELEYRAAEREKASV